MQEGKSAGEVAKETLIGAGTGAVATPLIGIPLAKTTNAVVSGATKLPKLVTKEGRIANAVDIIWGFFLLLLII